jgi:uncharacterized Zn finger protein (UPF0148 family)
MAKVECPQCGGKFKSEQTLRVHQSYKHAQPEEEAEPEAREPAARKKKRTAPKRDPDGSLADTRDDAAYEGSGGSSDGLDFLDL